MSIRETHVRRHRRSGSHNHGDLEPESAAARVCDLHGTALFSVAVAVVHDYQLAEMAVVDVICAAFSSSVVSEMAADDLQRELARRVYQGCGGAAAVEGTADHRQHVAIALIRHGGFTYRQVADLLLLPAADIVDLLDTCLRSQVRTD